MLTTRRDVLRLGLLGAGLGLQARGPLRATSVLKPLPDATPKKLPRWRGFNLFNKLTADSQKPFEERDFADIAELGFDFVRLPLDYRCWTEPARPSDLKEPVPQGDRPGRRIRQEARRYTFRSISTGPLDITVAKPAEPKSIWSDPDDPGKCAHAVVSLRRTLSRPTEQRGELQSAERARRQGQAGGSPPRRRAS